MAAHLYIYALYELYTYSNLISAACTSSIHCVRTTHDPGYVVWFIRPVIIRVKGNYPCATIAAIFDPQNPCNCGGVFTLSMRHRSSRICRIITMTKFLFYIIIIRKELYNMNKLGTVLYTNMTVRTETIMEAKATLEKHVATYEI